MALQPVMTKARVRFGTPYPAQETEYQVEITPNKCISIFKNGQLCNTFAMGDEAEYDSYNLSYTGQITGISPRQITIVAYKGTGCEKVKKLDIYAFCWRNYNFDAAETAAKNFETMQYI